MLRRIYTIIIGCVFISGCASRPLRYSDDFRAFDETSKKLKKATIYFRDSTYATASSIETDGHMIYWVDKDTKKEREDLLSHVKKISFRDRSTAAGIGGLLGAIITYFTVVRHNPNLSSNPKEADLLYDILTLGTWSLFNTYVSSIICLGTGSAAGGLVGFGFGVPITYTVSDSIR